MVLYANKLFNLQNNNSISAEQEFIFSVTIYKDTQVNFYDLMKCDIHVKNLKNMRNFFEFQKETS